MLLLLLLRRRLLLLLHHRCWWRRVVERRERRDAHVCLWVCDCHIWAHWRLFSHVLLELGKRLHIRFSVSKHGQKNGSGHTLCAKS